MSEIMLASAILFVLCCCFSARSFAMPFQAGAARRIITPDPLLPVSGGVGTPCPVQEKRGDLSVNAVVFEKDGERVAMAVIDNLGWPRIWGDKSRALIPGIKPENILIAATHTHSAPDAYCFPDEEGNHHADMDYIERVCVLVAEAVNDAVTHLQPAVLRIAVGEAKGKIAYNYYAPDLYDPRCAVLQALTPDNKSVIATLVNYAIHPETLGPHKGILSPDLCGPLRDHIEAEAGGIALFINGAQGGMITADNRSPDGDLETWDECVRIGTLLGREALRIIEKAPEQADPILHCMARDIALPVDSPLMQMLLQQSPMASQMERLDRVVTQLNVITLGTALMLTIPGEALPNIGYYLKRNMPTKYPFLLGLTNDAYGYMLCRHDFDSFERYQYISQTSMGEMTGEIYCEQALQLVRDATGNTDANH